VTPVRIRAASDADIRTIRSIALAAWPAAYREILSEAQLAYMLETRYSEEVLLARMERGELFLLAHAGEQAVGFAGFELDLGQRRITRLHRLYLHPGQMGTGMGRMLLHAVFKAARKAGDVAVNLNVNKYNPSLGFYLHLGFQCIGEEVLDIGQGYVMDDFILERPVSTWPGLE